MIRWDREKEKTKGNLNVQPAQPHMSVGLTGAQLRVKDHERKGEKELSRKQAMRLLPRG